MRHARKIAVGPGAALGKSDGVGHELIINAYTLSCSIGTSDRIVHRRGFLALSTTV